MKFINCIVSATMIAAFGIQGGYSEEEPTVGIHPDGRGRGWQGGTGYPGKREERGRHLEQEVFTSMSMSVGLLHSTIWRNHRSRNPIEEFA